jgi:hypothetical protein
MQFAICLISQGSGFMPLKGAGNGLGLILQVNLLEY